MDIKATLKELSDRLGPPKTRAAHGQWLPYAWLVRGLVEQGHGVTSAVRHVLENSGIPHNPTAFGSLRASYYHIKDAEWPAALSNMAVKKTETTEFE